MALYFFDVSTIKGLSTDDDGADFTDAASAEYEARLAVLELAKDRSSDGLDEISVQVRNASGQIIVTVTSSVTVVRSSFL